MTNIFVFYFFQESSSLSELEALAMVDEFIGSERGSERGEEDDRHTYPNGGAVRECSFVDQYLFFPVEF